MANSTPPELAPTAWALVTALSTEDIDTADEILATIDDTDKDGLAKLLAVVALGALDYVALATGFPLEVVLARLGPQVSAVAEEFLP